MCCKHDEMWAEGPDNLFSLLYCFQESLTYELCQLTVIKLISGPSGCETSGILFGNHLRDNECQLKGVWGISPRKIWEFWFKMVGFWGTLNKFVRCQTDFLKRLKVAKKILPGAKPVCQVPNLALGTHFRNTDQWTCKNGWPIKICRILSRRRSGWELFVKLH